MEACPFPNANKEGKDNKWMKILLGVKVGKFILGISHKDILIVKIATNLYFWTFQNHLKA